jgi:hypothetical protein
MPELAAFNSALPEEYKLIERIRDMWSNNCTDVEIRDVLNISKDRWEELLIIIKATETTTGDNRIAYEKFLAKQRKRHKQLDELANYSIATDQLPTAVKCFQMQSEMDRSDIEMGQKLSILTGETIHVKGELTHTDVHIQALFAHLAPDLKEQAEQDMKLLTQALVSEGIFIDDGKGTKSKE